MMTHHMIGSSVAHDGEQGNVWQWTKKTRSRATEIEMDTDVKQRSTEMKHKSDMRQEPIRNRKRSTCTGHGRVRKWGAN